MHTPVATTLSDIHTSACVQEEKKRNDESREMRVNLNDGGGGGDDGRSLSLVFFCVPWEK